MGYPIVTNGILCVSDGDAALPKLLWGLLLHQARCQTHDSEGGVGEDGAVVVGGDALEYGTVVFTQHSSVQHAVALHATPRVEVG